ncbi:hypothetical protein [Stenomitos frigidus]|uniref:Low temperature-induced protein n=1 Tax=Stenomitos frigidus ULC18 TaxID=2107698 RepID=A0A2T1E1W4_9CYAN|nr:hypothetical protein [Stenomitos frigidus]PSB26700.1 hypothetical protein C7B82_19055 [Stenomitos frigidus ULC18]
MNHIAQLRKFFTVSLLAVALLMGTAFSSVTQSALAGDTHATNEVSNFKGDSSNVNRSYHELQEAAHDFRQNFRDDITSGQRTPSKDRTNSPKQAAKNVSKNTRGAFGRTADAIKDTLDPG